VFAVVVGVASGECAQVVVADLFEDNRVELVGAGSAGLVCALVGVEQGVGHGLGPELPQGVGVTEGTQVSEEMSRTPSVHSGQVRVTSVTITHEGAGELQQHSTGVDIVTSASADVHQRQILGAGHMHIRQRPGGAPGGLVGV
jgi:hypothetical protein